MSKSKDYTKARVNPKLTYGLWVITTCAVGPSTVTNVPLPAGVEMEEAVHWVSRDIGEISYVPFD